MDKLPASVLNTLTELKNKHKHSVSLSRIRNKFYVLETIKKFVESKNRYITFTHYLGRILEDGTFIEAKHRKAETDTDSLDDLIRMKLKNANNTDLSETELKILTSLSTDARRPVADLARELNMSTTSVEYRIKKLESKYGIEYLIELPVTTAFNFSRFVIMVKFTGDHPDLEEVKAALQKEAFVQLALATKGEYDLFIVVLADDTVDLGRQLYKLRNGDAFSRYRSIWNVSSLSSRGVGYGFIPLRENFLDLLEKRVWHKSQESPARMPTQLLEREYIVLKELCKNSIMNFAEIDKKHGLSVGSSQYTYHKLIEKKIIQRATITMNHPPLKYIAILHLDQLNMHSFSDTREALLFDRISFIKSPLNKYALSGDFTAPDGIVNITPIIEQGDLSKLENSLKEKIKGTAVRSLIVADILVGRLEFRRLDYHETRAYQLLTEEYKYTEEEIRRKAELISYAI